MNILWESSKVYTAFLNFTGHTFSKENIEARVKLLGSNVLNCCLKVTTANLRKIGLTMNYVSNNIGRGHVPHSTTPLPPQESAPLGDTFT